MNIISFMTANYVAREVGYHMTRGWGQGDKATNDAFRPLETFGERFERILWDIRAMGFETIDLWTSHLNPVWAMAEHIAIAHDLLARYRLPVVSLAGWFGSTPEEFEATCKLAVAFDRPILGGSTSVFEKDRAWAVEMLKKYDVRLAWENHPQKSPQELLDKIGDPEGGRIGVTVDTGWFGTHGYDAAQAIEELDGHIMHVHLKDVLAPGAHDTCRYGRGVVPIEVCVRALRASGYRGAISVEHEPELFDPSEDCIANLAMLRDWLAR